MLAALTSLIDQQVERGAYLEAEAALRRQLSLDSWNELIWRRLMLFLSENGRRAQALAEFHNCQQLLKKELGIPPSAETIALFEAIRDGQLHPQSPPGSHYAVPPPKPLPHQSDRNALIHKIEEQWISNLLHPSLGSTPYIRLSKQSQPSALAYPWTTLIQRPTAKRPKQIANQSIFDLFEAEGRGLLILGEPGSGKTTSLLTLAQTLLSRAKTDPSHPIPVVLPLISWQGESLSDWIASEINEKHRIVTQTIADWIAQQQLILLLDGFDELPTDLQPACAAAINQFRENYGLTQMAVCSRQADYDALATPLNLNAAIQLQPLNQDQIQGFVGDQFTNVVADKGLNQLAKSPLLLSLIVSIYGDLSDNQLKEISSDHDELFKIYLDSQLKPNREQSQLSPEKLRRFLTWLAHQLTTRNRSAFLLDRIQPDWLGSRWQVVLYFLLSRFLGGGLLAILWSFRDLGWGSIKAGIGLGIVIATIEAIFLLISQRTSWFSGLSLRQHQLIRSLVFGLVIILILIPYGWVALVNGLIFGLFFGWRPPTHTESDDIKLVEMLAWRWPTFFWGLGISLVLSIIVFAYNWNNLYAAGTGLLSIVVLISTFGGLLGRTSATKTRANEGMWLTWRNMLFGGSVIGGAMLLAASIIEYVLGGSPFTPFLVGLQYFCMAALWYGGLDLLNHFTLRAILAGQGNLPWRTIPYLEEASRRRLLYRAGGGYLFIHAKLRDRFAKDLKN